MGTMNMQGEMVLESNEHDRQPEMRGSECDEETKQSNDELHEGAALIAMCNVNESVDATISDNEQSDVFTYPNTLNWIFSQNVPGINFETIGMDM